MHDVLIWTATAFVAFIASTISGVVGFGGAMLFLPALVAVYGIRASVPILTVAVLMGNASRVFLFRRQLNWKLIILFSMTAVPFAVWGSFVYVSLPTLWIKKGIGAFLIVCVVLHKLHPKFQLKQAWVFTPLGAVTGFLSALIGGVGPISSPFFLAYGLAKEAFVGTEAVCAVGMHLAKSVTYHELHVLDHKALISGLGFGIVMSVGSLVAKKILERLSRDQFLFIVEIALTVVGIIMLF